MLLVALEELVQTAAGCDSNQLRSRYFSTPVLEYPNVSAPVTACYPRRPGPARHLAA